MILEPIEIPSIDPSLPPEEQVAKLRSAMTDLVETLNGIFAMIQDNAGFNTSFVGTPNERAEGKARRVSVSDSDIDMGGHRIKGAGSPMDPQDLVTLEYLQSALKKKEVTNG